MKDYSHCWRPGLHGYLIRFDPLASALYKRQFIFRRLPSPSVFPHNSLDFSPHLVLFYPHFNELETFTHYLDYKVSFFRRYEEGSRSESALHLKILDKTWPPCITAAAGTGEISQAFLYKTQIYRNVFSWKSFVRISICRVTGSNISFIVQNPRLLPPWKTMMCNHYCKIIVAIGPSRLS